MKSLERLMSDHLATDQPKKPYTPPSYTSNDVALVCPLLTLNVINASRYYNFMIASIKDSDTEQHASGKRIRRFESIERIALRKIRQLQIANALTDLRIPPGNRLEALTGNRSGQYGIRINDQYRICFRWIEGKAEDVEIVDYH